MPRATQPVTFDEVVAAMPDYYPDVTAESNAADYGRLGNRMVVLDYGLPDDAMMKSRRIYYKTRVAQFSIGGDKASA